MKSKLLLVGLLSLMLFVAGCQGFGSDRAKACAEGDNCRFYTGSQGVDIVLDRPPSVLYYRTADAMARDGNMVALNVRVHNRGASDSIGGVFVSGFGPVFEVYRQYDDGRQELVDIRGLSGACTFNFGSFGVLPNFNFNCGGIGIQGSGNRATFSFNFNKINEHFGVDYLPENVRARLTVGQGGFGLNLAFDGFLLNTLYHGKLLISILVGNFDFDALNGMSYFLRGDNPEYPGGGDDFKQFLIQMHGSWPSGTDELNIPYQVRSCYAYTTFVSPQVCVDPDPFGTERGVCRANQDINLGTQGAPVAVTRMSQRNTGRSVIMDFEVRNVGNGRVWEVGSLERCSPYYPETATGRNFHDVIYIGYAMVDDFPLDCPQRVIRLNNGVGRFTCTYNFQENAIIGSAYITPLRLELWYGYEQNIQNNLRVRRIS